MTEKRVIIDQDREATPDQMIQLQDGIEASIDHIVLDTLVPGRGYAGLLVSAVGTVVTVGVGRFYQNGRVYAFDTPITIDMQPKLPLATKRQVLIVVSGIEQDTDIQEVNFLVEAESTPAAPVYKPSSVATTHVRVANVQPAYGDEAPNPPTPDVGLALPVARILLTPAGIASCGNLVDGRVPVLAEVTARTSALEAFRDTVGPQVSSLASDLANLANSPKSVSQQAFARVLLRVAALDARLNVPSNAADSSVDYLLTDANADLAHPLSNCRVQEGIRFPRAGEAQAVLNLFNPFEAAGVVKAGTLFPAYDRYLRSTTGPATGAVLANSYTYNPVSYTQQTTSSTRVRYGTEFSVCSNSAWWQQGTYDPLNGVFSLPDGSTYRAAADLDTSGRNLEALGIADPSITFLTQHMLFRAQQFWTDTTTATYWDAVVQAPQTIPGYHLAESELVGQDHYLDAIGFTLTKLDAQGSVTVLVCEATTSAQPDPARVLARVDIPYANLVVGENVAALATPVLRQSGKRYATVIVTAGGHAIATTDGANFPSGTYFVLAPSGYAQGDLTKHLALNFYSCKFRQSAVTLQLQNLQLAGGIASIDILAQSIVPPSTALTYAVQVAGVWMPLAAATAGQLSAGGSLPPNLPLQVTMTGTPDLMPCLSLAKSNAIVSRPATTVAAIWPKFPRTPPVATSQIRVIERYESYDAAFHSWGCKLLTGAGYTTQTAPSSFTDSVDTDGSLVRTYVFNLGAAVTSYKVLTTGTTTSALKVGHVANIKDYVL